MGQRELNDYRKEDRQQSCQTEPLGVSFALK